MDKITLKNMAFYAYHGALDEENKMGQRFFIDCTLHLDLEEAGRSDRLEDTVNYVEVYQIIEKINGERKFSLLEALGEEIIDAIAEKFYYIDKIEVNIRKPSVPIAGILDYVEVTRVWVR